jgi:hypothetical protein
MGTQFIKCYGNSFGGTSLSNGLICYLSMRNDGATVINESSGLNAIAVGSPVFNSLSGIRDIGVQLNGVNQWLEVSPLVPTNGMTVSLWAKGFPTSGGFALCSRRNVASGSGYGWDFSVASDGRVFFGVNDNSFRVNSPATTRQTGVWYNFVGTYNSTDGATKLFINGVESASNNIVPQLINSANSKITIGRRDLSGTDASFMAGDLDEFALWNRSLTANEIMTMYSSQLFAPYK